MVYIGISKNSMYKIRNKKEDGSGYIKIDDISFIKKQAK